MFIEQTKQKSIQLFECYNAGFRPPQWIIPKFEEVYEYFKYTELYYDTEDITEDRAIELYTKREPVNIAMSRNYNRGKMEKYFGYVQSTYMYYPIHPRSEPEKNGNIAVFCRTPVCIMATAREMTWKKANVLNVIGVALDNKEQADYLYLKNHSNPQEEYLKMVDKIFRKIVKCFIEHKFENLILSAFGAGNFGYFAGELGIDVRETWKQCFYKYLDEMNYSQDTNIILNYIDFIPDYKLQTRSPIEKMLWKTDQDTLDKTLFINAWDPHSVIGNGNEYDNSLDGYWGRISAMSVIGTGTINSNVRIIGL